MIHAIISWGALIVWNRVAEVLGTHVHEYISKAVCILAGTRPERD